MSGATTGQVIDPHTAGSYSKLSFLDEKLTSDQRTPNDQQDTSEDLESLLNSVKVSTESGKRANIEKSVVNLITAVIPDVEHIFIQGQLDSIKKKSEETGAINAHLDMINMLLTGINENLDMQFVKFDSMKARF